MAKPRLLLNELLRAIYGIKDGIFATHSPCPIKIVTLWHLFNIGIMIFPYRNHKTTRNATRGWNPLSLIALTSLWIASVANWPFWRAVTALPELEMPRGIMVLCGFFGIIVALIYGLIALFAWRWTVKPVIALFLLAAA